MTDIDARLERCFSAVFPALGPESLRAASSENVPDWDSLAAVRLVAVVEEEFGVPIELDAWPDMGSFASIKRYLLQRSVGP